MHSTHPGQRPSSPPHAHLGRSEPAGRTKRGSSCGSSASSSPEPPAPLGGGRGGGAAWSALLPGAEAAGAAGAAGARRSSWPAPSSWPARSSAVGGTRAPSPSAARPAGAAVRGAGASSGFGAGSVATGSGATGRSGHGSLGFLISKRSRSRSRTPSGTMGPNQSFRGTMLPSPSSSTTALLVPWRPWVKLVRQRVAAITAPNRVCAMVSARATSSAVSG